VVQTAQRGAPCSVPFTKHYSGDQVGKKKWARLVEDIGKRSANRILVGKRDGKRPGRGSRRRWERNIKMNLHEIYGGVDWIDVLRIGARGRILCRR
jgi:hypothetical protein